MSRILEALRRESHGPEPALAGPHGVLTYDALHAEVEALANRLRQLNVRRLALLADNSPAWVAADLACLSAGIALVPLPGFFTSEQLQHVLRTAAIGHVLVAAAARVSLPLDAAPRTRLRIAQDDFDCISLGARNTTVGDAEKITFTSGTTGRPKGVRLNAASQEAVALSLAVALRPLELRRHMAVLPFATLLENLAGIYVPLLLGAVVYVPPLGELGYSGASGLDAARLVAAVCRHRPESLILVPALLQALVAAAEGGAMLPDSLRFVAVGGGRVAASLIERARAAGLPVYEGYGLSECGSVVTLNLPGAERLGSAGRPLPHARIAIADDGEIFVHGPHYAGYVGAPDVPADVAVATGDIGHLDADGFLHITGRKKSIFITAFGRNVSPEWVEAELTAEPAIQQAVVFGEAQPCNVAVLVSTADDRAVEQALHRANTRLPDYARVRRWLRAAAPFTAANGQLTPNGRARRAAVWEAYRASIDSLHLEGQDQ